MSFKNEVLETIKSLPQWKDISAEPVDVGDAHFRRNAQRCYEINVDIAHALNAKPDVEAIVAGTHYPNDNPSCANYYVLARYKPTGEILLADAVINSGVPDMREPFIGSLAEAKGFMGTHPGLKWNQLWNFSHIVVHEPQVSVNKRNSTRNRWGELGEHFNFDPPVAGLAGPLNLEGDKPFASTGYTLTLEDMNRFAANRPSMNTNLYARRPVTEETVAATAAPEPVQAVEEKPHRSAHAHPQPEPAKKGWRNFFLRTQSSLQTQNQSAERS